MQNQEFDLIFMGQVIEHIQPAAIPEVLAWIRDHLANEGRFIFDTPNRKLTAIQNPAGYIDDDHKIEYTPRQLRKKLSNAGLRVVDETGLLPMPQTLNSGCFNPLETYEQPLLSPHVEEGYLFAFACTQN